MEKTEEQKAAEREIATSKEAQRLLGRMPKKSKGRSGRKSKKS
jgi:hypothetical protein